MWENDSAHLFVLFQHCYWYSRACDFPYNFRVNFPMFTNIHARILIGIRINLWINRGRIDIFTLLSSNPWIQYIYLFYSFYQHAIFNIYVLSCTFFVKCIPKVFFFLRAIVSGIVFLILFLCVLILVLY